MRRRTQFGFLLAILFGGACLVAFLLLRPPPEPEYEGKRLGQWLATRYTREANGQLHLSGAASEAVRKIGTNGIPTLLRMIQAQDSLVTVALRRLISRLPGSHRIDRDAGYLKADGLFGFEVLGESAASAVPELIQIYQTADPKYTIRNCAVAALGSIGPPARAAIPLLIADLTSPNELTRYEAVTQIVRIGGEPGLIVPILTKMLSDPATRMKAVEGLGIFRQDAKGSVPELLLAFGEANGPLAYDLKRAIEASLWRIAPETIPNALQIAIPPTMELPRPGLWEIVGFGHPWLHVIDGDEPARIAEAGFVADPQEKIHLYRRSGSNKRLVAQVEILRLPGRTDASISFGLADGKVYLWARATAGYLPLEMRQVQ